MTASFTGILKSRPSNIWSGDEEARGVVEQLNRDAGYEPVHMGGLDKAATQEHGIEIIFAIAQTTGCSMQISGFPGRS